MKTWLSTFRVFLFTIIFGTVLVASMEAHILTDLGSFVCWYLLTRNVIDQLRVISDRERGEHS